jgi:hypothetical protein
VQVYDLVRHVPLACGRRTTAMMALAEYFVWLKGIYSLVAWEVDGWPVAASGVVNWTHWQIVEEK